MNLTPPFVARCIAYVWLAMVCLAGSTAFSEDLTFRPASGGLQMTLSTNGYQFHVGQGGWATQAKAKRKQAAFFPVESFVASAVLANRGIGEVPFTFGDEAAAERKFRFKVFSADGAQIWESESDPAEAAEPVEETLVRRSPWRRTVQVPLNINGQWLASGRYTLEASVDAAGGPGATAVFEVVNLTVPGIPPAPDTGIRGKVVMSSIWVVPSSATYLPPGRDLPVRAYVTVREIVPPNAETFRAPYSWSGFTDAQGSFTAPTIAGRFRVTASLDNLLQPTTANMVAPIDQWPTRSATVEVEVPLGQYVDTLLRIGRGPGIVTGANVYSVNEVSAIPIPAPVATQRMLRITATGMVTSGGWSNGQLVQRPAILVFPPDDRIVPPILPGVLEFDFVAAPPKELATTVMSPITATKDVLVMEGVREIRVYSKTNSQSVVVPPSLIQ